MHSNPVANGLLSGAVAAAVAAILHLMFLQPVLLRAEDYESGARVHNFAAAPAEHDHAAAETDAAASGTEGATEEASGGMPTRFDTPLDLARDAQTVGFFLVVYAAYGLFLAAAVGLARGRGYRPERGHVVLWAAAGFAAFALVPSFGLAPELPGMAAGPLEARQLWWVVTAAVTATTLAGVAVGGARAPWAGLVGVAVLTGLMLLAPEPEALTGPVPPELSAAFAGRSLGLAAVAWLVLAACVLHRPQRALVGSAAR
jgi:cobalt transporter subunit CbtA